MSAVALRRAELNDLAALEPLVRSFHYLEGISSPGGDVSAAVSPLLGDSDLGRVWSIRSGEDLVGYVAICFGYSIEFGGRDAFIDELFIAEEYRGRGIGARVLTLVKAEAEALGVRALHLEVSRKNTRAQDLYRRLGFAARDQYFLMSARPPAC